MKLTLKIKLLPTDEQSDLLLETMTEANTVCNAISDVAWEKRIFNNFKLHHEVYYPIKATFQLASQMIIRQISKVANAYKLDKKTKRVFKTLGAITYDHDIMTYKPNNVVSLWCIGGRQKINFICHNTAYFHFIRGQADLVYKKGKFYLFQIVDVPEENIIDVDDFIGVDAGITDIVVTSDGEKYTAETLNNYREHRQKVRSSIQAKADTSKRSTKRNCRKLSKRLQGKEKTTATIINHTISKKLVQSAKQQGKGIAIEDLTHIRFTSKRRNKKLRVKLGNWSFYQLRSFIEYKAKLNGVEIVVVEPAYTSQTCSVCHCIGTRKNKSFKCTNCGNDMDADFNAARNIATLGVAISRPEKSSMYCSLHSA